MLLDFLLPAPCVICGRLPKPLCQSCKFKPRVQRDLLLGLPISHCGELSGEIEKVVTSFKDKQRLALRGFLSDLINEAVLEVNSAVEFDRWAIPPRNKENFRRRGFHPIELIANSSSLSGYPRVPVRSVRRLSDQRSLTSLERRLNLREAYSMSPGEGRILLVDDVLTTGATLGELSRAATAAGYQSVGFCVIARRTSNHFELEGIRRSL